MSGRKYAGETAEDRLAKRRHQLLEGGLEIFGTVGYRAARVRDICRVAKVADRHFYEHFGNTEELLIAVYEAATQHLLDETVSALSTVHDIDIHAYATAGLDALLRTVQNDPRLGRVVWLEVLGVSHEVEEVYLGQMRRFAALLLTFLPEERAASLQPAARRLLLDATVGGVSHVVLSWIVSGMRARRRTILEALTDFLDCLAAGPSPR